MAVGATVRMHRPNVSPTRDREGCGRATFDVRQSSSTRLVVAVVGDIDAVNARAVGRYIERHIRVSKQLVLDLRAVDFIGSQAFAALYYISVHCGRGDVDWIIVGSHPVRRLLSICDPDGELPVVDDLQSGLALLDRLAHCHYHAAPTG
jgi:anti-anti-sigma factor